MLRISTAGRRDLIRQDRLTRLTATLNNYTPAFVFARPIVRRDSPPTSRADDATIQSARDLYGFGSSAERAVTQAGTAVGVN